MKTLEIKVNDIVFVADTFSKVMKIIRKAILKWFNSDDEEPLSFSLRKIEDRGPPSLGIDVLDGIGTRSGLT